MIFVIRNNDMSIISDFSTDLKNNPRLRPTKRAWWVLLLIRVERSVNAIVLKRVIAAIKKVALLGTASELPAQAFVGVGLCMPHISSMIVTPFAAIGSNCKLHQQITIGIDEYKSVTKGPSIGDRVFIGAGAKIIGPICIGNDVIIGANAVVTKDVPSNVTVVGANKIIKSELNSSRIVGYE